jgi:hypothetical protein
MKSMAVPEVCHWTFHSIHQVPKPENEPNRLRAEYSNQTAKWVSHAENLPNVLYTEKEEEGDTYSNIL